MRSGKLSATRRTYTKLLKMNMLTLDHADDHAAERLQVTGILLHDVHADALFISVAKSDRPLAIQPLQKPMKLVSR